MPLYNPQDEELLARLAAVGVTIETDSEKQCYTLKSGTHALDVSFSDSRDQIVTAAEVLVNSKPVAPPVVPPVAGDVVA